MLWEQQKIKEIDEDLLRRVATNDIKQQNYIELVDELVYVHNEQFEARCP